MNIKMLKAVLAGLVLSSSCFVNAGIIHITDGDSQIVQGFDLTTGNLIYSTDVGGSGRPYAIAATDSNVYLASYNNNDSFILDLNGNVVSSSSYTGSTLGNEVDGTTDGSFFYTFEWDSSDVMRYDTSWENPSVLFSPGLSTSFNGGIAYDSISQSLWLSTTTDIYNYAMDGTFLSSFSHAGFNGSLSFDDSDGTLWYVPNCSTCDLLQYSNSGSLLTSLTTQIRVSNAWGSEISVSTASVIDVPEPSTLAIFALGIMGLASRRFKKQ